MKCKDCGSCMQGWFTSEPGAYVCIGVKEPFVINDINHECTEYPEKAIDEILTVPECDFSNAPEFYVDDEAIWASIMGTPTYQQVISKEMFVEAYNKWIKGVHPSEDIYRLNPCFKCGSTIVVEPYGNRWVVQCTHCGTRLEYVGTMEELAAFWNSNTKEK